jgi:two-component system CheB/CheR fusion protein
MATRKRLRKARTGRPTRRTPVKRAKGTPTAVARHVETTTPTPESDIIIVGVGASAGGLEAFSQLLEALPNDPGFGMVFVQHLAPQHESALPVLLSAKTALQVVHAAEGMQVARNHVYVIPPNIQMGIADGRLHLTPRPTDRSQYNPIDFFLNCLAGSAHDHAIGVILSGTASDGALGLRDIKAAGGIAIAQKPESAKYDGMPRAAIATGVVDLILPPAEIARELVRIGRHPLRRVHAELVRLEAAEESEESGKAREEHLEQIFALLRGATGVDFRRYKRPTIQRRLQRRMVLHRTARVEQYLKLLRERPAEIQLLYQDILIHVTHFFREPEAFDVIREQIIPKILQGLRDEQPIRVWVPGCSTGEEAYSIAMVLLEYLDGTTTATPIQVFATDISDTAIDQARSGFYPQSIAADVSPERLRRFFSKIDGGYRINKAVRDLCIFARQDVTRDPPFSKLDLILCRNVLIYLGAELQKRLMTVFHYALKPVGFLVLGAAETIGAHSDLFSGGEKKQRIYQKRLLSAGDQHPAFEYTAMAPVQGRSTIPVARADAKSAQGEASRIIEEKYAPPGVIVDGDMHIVQFRGQTGAYLAPAPGDPSMSLLKMARDGLLHSLRSAVQEARKTRTATRKEGVRVKANGGWHTVDIDVVPLTAMAHPHFLVLFHDVTGRESGPAKRQRAAAAPPVPLGRRDQQISRLQQELATSRQYLQSIIQELEAANEELQSANEEVLSANEELQSTNEELDTAKEELQSTNEELNTLNEELHSRNDELGQLNSDLLNLLGSVNIAIIIVANDLRIRRFTPMAERILNLLPGDVGRPIGHLRPNIDCPDLEEQIQTVIDTVTPLERDVRDPQGNWYSLRIRPYKTIDNRIDGAVLALFDTQSGHRRDADARKARDFADTIIQMVQQPLIVVDGAARVTSANKAFCEAFEVLSDEIQGKTLFDLRDGEWDIGPLREGLEETLRADGSEPFQLEHEFRSLGQKSVRLTARRIEAGSPVESVVVVAVEDVAD